MVRATFGSRFTAFLLDLLLVGLVTSVLRIVVDPGVALFLQIVVLLGYFTYFDGSPSGQTIGKKWMNVRVVDAAGGGPLGPSQALVRALVRCVSVLAALLGCLWMLWDRDRRTWHDKAVGTAVVPVADHPVAAWPG
jgi:uncharacterized RDD family membrane protein YckC